METFFDNLLDLKEWKRDFFGLKLNLNAENFIHSALNPITKKLLNIFIRFFYIV